MQPNLLVIMFFFQIRINRHWSNKFCEQIFCPFQNFSLLLKKIDDVEICSPDRFFPNFIYSANECVFINWPFLDAKYGEYIYVFFSCGVGKFEIWRESTKKRRKRNAKKFCAFLFGKDAELFGKNDRLVSFKILYCSDQRFTNLIGWFSTYWHCFFSYVKRVISMSYTYIFVCFIGILSKIRASING